MVQDFVLFTDNLEDENNPQKHFGLLLADDTIICLCCGGIVEPENYEIIERFGTEQIHYIDDILKENW